MTSWRAPSMVTTRRSILTMRSTIGIRKINPGPFVPSSLPRRKITPRSYSRRMRIICGRMITARRITGSNQTSNLANSSNIRPLPQVLGFHFCRQSFDGNDLYGSPLFRLRQSSSQSANPSKIIWTRTSNGAAVTELDGYWADVAVAEENKFAFTAYSKDSGREVITWFDYETEQQAMHAAVDFMRDGKDPSGQTPEK